jgi:hypothetical protein
MLRKPPFPISPEELTEEVLSESLGKEVNSFSYTRIGSDRGMLGVVLLLDISYSDGSTENTNLVCKFPALREGSMENNRRGNNNERELRFYDELSHITPIRTPKFHSGWYDPDTEHFMLIQQAIDVDENVDQIKGISVEQAMLVLDEVASLHAKWWEHPDLNKFDWLPKPNQREKNLSFIASTGWEPLCEMLKGELTEQEISFGNKITQRVGEMLDVLSSYPETLIHSDLRADNLLFTREDSKVFIVDWQGTSKGPAGWDLAYFMTSSLSVETRRENEEMLLNHYVNSLKAAGKNLDPAEALAGYADGILYGLVIACSLPLISDESEERVKELARVITRRSIDAMKDHNKF